MQTNIFNGADAFQAKFSCSDPITGPVSSCNLNPSPPPPPPSPPSPPPIFLTNMLEDTNLKIYANDHEVNYQFGRAVTLYGDTALIGANHDNNNNVVSSGSVYIFLKSSVDDSSIFIEQAKLFPSDPLDFDEFGISLSIFENTALIGAKNKMKMKTKNAGCAYVFERKFTTSIYSDGSSLIKLTTWIEETIIFDSN